MIYFLYGHMVKKIWNILWNTFTSNLKFTFECDRNSINFLDLTVINNGELTTSVYIKLTHRHQYLQRSSHPDHVKRSIVYSQSLQASRLCSCKENFVKYSEKMKNWFSKRGYPDKIIKNELKKVNFGESKS